MNCYEWRHQIEISGMKISCEASWQTTNELVDPPEAVSLTASGETEFGDITPPTSRRGMRCGEGYTSTYARRRDWKGYGRFELKTGTGPTVGGITVTSTSYEEPYIISDSAVASENYSFVSGLYEPWLPSDPAYVCAKGIWSKSTEYTKNKNLSLRGWIVNIPWPFNSNFPTTYLGGNVLDVIYHREIEPFTADVLLDFNLRGELAKIADGAEVTWKFFDMQTQEYVPAGNGTISYTMGTI